MAQPFRHLSIDYPLTLPQFTENASKRKGSTGLLCAIIEDAIICYLEDDSMTPSYNNQSQSSLDNLSRQSGRWLFSDDCSQWRVPFLLLCDLLGLDPEPIRAAVRREKARRGR